MRSDSSEQGEPHFSSDEERAAVIHEIAEIMTEWEREVAHASPRMRWSKRALLLDEGDDGALAFHKRTCAALAELDDDALCRYAQYIRTLKKNGLNLVRFTAERRAISHGYASLHQAERKLAAKSPRYIR